LETGRSLTCGHTSLLFFLRGKALQDFPGRLCASLHLRDPVRQGRGASVRHTVRTCVPQSTNVLLPTSCNATILRLSFSGACTILRDRGWPRLRLGLL